MADTREEEGASVASTEETTPVDPVAVQRFISGISFALLDVDAAAAAESVSNGANQEVLQAFIKDRDIPMLLVVATASKQQSGDDAAQKTLVLLSDWKKLDEEAMVVAVVKSSLSLSGAEPLSSQLQVLSLGSLPVVDVLHTYVQRSFKPLLEGYFSAVSQKEAEGPSRDLSGGALVRRKVAELELALRGCQQEVKVPDVSLNELINPDIRALVPAIAKAGGQQEKEDLKEQFLSKAKASEEMKDLLCNSIMAWHKELHDLSARYERRMGSDGEANPAQEREFWVRMEKVMSSVEEQTRQQEVELTLEIVKKLKIRGHIPKQFEEDVTTLKSKLESTQKFNILMKDFPVGEIQTAPDLSTTAAAIVKVLEHVRKHLMRSRYPVARAWQLLEAISSEVSVQVKELLSKKQLMSMRYEDFVRLCGFAAKQKAPDAAKGKDAPPPTPSCKYVFDCWDGKERELIAERSKLSKFTKDAPTDPERTPLSAFPHRTLEERLQELARFRRDHESLKTVIVKVSSQSRLQLDALEVLRDAYERVKVVDALDASKDGEERWQSALDEYNAMVDRVETTMTANLRNSLGAAKDARDMFRIFSVFNPLLVRPRIRSAIQEYQNKLLVQVKDDVKELQERFKKKYSNSEAARITTVRDLPPVAGSIIWARQVERQLTTYMQRIKHVLGEGWQDHPEGQKLKLEGDAFRDKLDPSFRFKKWREEALAANREVLDTFTVDAFVNNVFRISVGGKKELLLEVNFDKRQTTLFKEVRSLAILGFKTFQSLDKYATELKRVFPYATAIDEALRTYFQAAAKVDDSVRPLLGGQRRKMHCYFKLGVDQKLLSTKEQYREVQRDFENEKQFLQDFVERRDFAHLELFTRKLCECALAFQDKVEAVLDKGVAVDKALATLQSCPLEKQQLVGALTHLQTLVSELELANYSNLASWVGNLDQRVEAILLERLEMLLTLWMECFKSAEEKTEQPDAPQDDDAPKRPKPTQYIRGLAKQAHIRHEIKIKNGQLFLDPPIELARGRWMAQLASTMAVVGDLPRIRHTAYSEFSEEQPTELKQKDTYQDLMLKLPPEVLRGAYDRIWKETVACEEYVGSWLTYQALWDIDAATAIAKLGDDIAHWVEVLSQVKSSRAIFDTVETQKLFGPISVDFAKVQNGVSMKYDAWHKELMSAFGQMLQDKMRVLFAELRDSREKLEGYSIEKNTSDVVMFLTHMQDLKAKKEGFESLIAALRDGERTLQKHRFKFAADWFYVQNLEGEWMAFLQIYTKKDSELKEEIPALQARIIEEDRAVSDKIKAAVADWGANKPVQGDIPPQTALDSLAVLESKITVLQEQYGRVAQAKDALGMEHLGSDKLSTVLEEMKDLKEAWVGLVEPWHKLAACGETAWNAVLPKKVRQTLEEVQAMLKELPASVRQYSAFEHVQGVVKGYLKANVIVIDLRSQMMKERHWDLLGTRLGVRWSLADMTLSSVWAADIMRHENTFREVLSVAQGELGLEEFLKQLKEYWQAARLDLVSYKQKVSLIRGWEELFTKVNENTNSLSSMRNSPYYKVFEDDASQWEDKLNRVRELFDLWAEIQRRWVYLEGIFLGSADIKHQLPMEFSRFKTIDNDFVNLMRAVAKKPLVLDVIAMKDLAQTLARLDDLLCKIQKSLAEYLERKRSSFPRFYFVGDDDLLEIIGSGKEPASIQRHLRKMFAGVQQFCSSTAEGSSSLELTGMQSFQGEMVAFPTHISLAEEPEVNVWLGQAEKSMQGSLRASLEQSVTALMPLMSAGAPDVDQLFAWTDQFACQVVLVAMQIVLSTKIEQELADGKTDLSASSGLCNGMLQVLADSVLGDLHPIRRKKIEHFIGELVHTQGVVASLLDKKVTGKQDFSWLYYMRFYHRPAEKDPKDKFVVSCANADFEYGFEYQGVADRLVQTPLTDRAYLTLTQALHSRMGGSPFGPAGTGKTETVKALAGQLGRFVLVFNCDEAFDLQAMGRIFLGLCQTGAWGCFDEFNRLEERILSAVSQQILTIQTAVRQGAAEVELIGRSLALNSNIGIFVTMNPGYAGRSNLPDNLKQLFRSVSMSKPDSELIAQIMLYTQGFRQAKELAKKAVPLFRLCADQLSQCSHYDFGLRALKSVLVGAGNMKRRLMASADAAADVKDEADVIIESFCGAVVPKLLQQDIPLLYSLLNDVFPGSGRPSFQNELLKAEIVDVCKERDFELGEEWLAKLMQLSQIVELHHGVMLVGPSGSGKSAAWHVLFEALKRVDSKNGLGAGEYHQLDPKALSKSALYGHLDATTREWTDGVFTSILRRIVDNQSTDKAGRHWIVLDGDVDPEWVENLNSVLDDNRLLTLPNGERIVLPHNVRIIFEVEGLQYATPATVSRCGMVWFSDETLQTSLVLSRFLRCLRAGRTSLSWDAAPRGEDDLDVEAAVAEALQPLLAAEGLVERALAHAATQEHVMAFSRQQTLNSLFGLITAAVGSILEYNAERPDFALSKMILGKYISKQALLAVLWSVGGSMELAKREELAGWIAQMTTVPLPGGSLIDHEVNIEDGEWVPWDRKVPAMEVETHKVASSDMLIATVDTVRHEELLQRWLKEHRPVLLCGPPGSGKTMTISACLRNLPDTELVALNFSSSTSPDLIMKTFDHYCEYKRTPDGTILRPQLSGKWLVVFCDEVNLPAADKYGTQHVIALLRQLIELGGFWRPSDLTWVKLERIQFIGACNPPTDAGRVPLTPRFLRHTPLLYVDFPGRDSLKQIYGTFCRALLKLVPALRANSQPLTDVLVEYYLTCKDHYNRDTQAHYIYSPRELSRWTRAMYEAIRNKDGMSPEMLVQLTAHEGLRLFQDRLTTDEERKWADDTMDRVIKESFPSMDVGTVLARPLLFCNWLTKDYVQVEQTAFRDFVKARLKVFYEEELNVPLVVFNQVLDHVLRIDRVLRQPLGHVLLIGASGAGKTVMSRFVAWHNGQTVFQIKAHRGYGEADFEDDLRKVMKRAGCKGETICFIFDESNVLSTGFLELMNALLASGEIPGLFDGDEWPALMQACREAASRDGQMLDTEDELYKRFIQEVQRNLHIIFTMNPASPEFTNRTATSPALFNRCVIDWVGDWSDDALEQVAEEFTRTLDLEIGNEEQGENKEAMDNFRRAVILAMVFVHRSVHGACTKVAKQHDHLLFVTPRHYIDFIQQFVRVFGEKRAQIEEQQLHLNIGLKRLTDTQDKVQELSTSLAAKEQELAAKEKMANEKLQQMVQDQQEAEKQREKTVGLQEEVGKSQAEIARRTEEVKKELAEAEPAVEDAKQAVQGIKKAQLDEVRSMGNPPANVKKTMECICIMLYESTKPTWDEIRKNIRKDDFIPGILNFETDVFKKDKAKMKAIGVFLEDQDFTFENVNKSSKACGPLVKWVRAQFRYADILERVSPLRAEVDALEKAGKASKDKLAELSGAIDDLEAKIAGYKQEYAALISEAQALKTEMQTVKDRVQRSTSLLQSLMGERDRWQRQTDAFGEQIATLVGDVLLSSVMLSYLGMFDQEVRQTVVNQVLDRLQTAKIPVREDLDIAEYLTTADERLGWHNNSLPEDALCVENAVMLKRFNRYPLVIDPAGQATEFLMKQHAESQITKTSFLDASFMKHLESAMRFGTPLMVTDVESIDPILNPVLNREISKTGGRVLIRLGDQEIDFSPTFCLYLSTRDSSCRFSPDLCSRVTLVNFTVTPGGLQSQCLSLVLKSERPDIDSMRSDMLKLQGEYKLRLTQLEKMLLASLTEGSGNILEDDKVIASLEQIKTESSEVEAKIEQQSTVHDQVQEVTRFYEPLAVACSRVYFALHAMAEVQPLYQFSVQFFLHLFDEITTRNQRLSGVTDHVQRRDILLEDLFNVTLKRASISLQNHHQSSLALRLAQLRLLGRDISLEEMELQALLTGGGGVAASTAGSQDKFPQGLLTQKQASKAAQISLLPNFKGLPEHMGKAEAEWKAFLEDPLAERCIPNPWKESGEELSASLLSWRSMLVVHALRPDRLLAASRAFIGEVLGEEALNMPDPDLVTILDTSPSWRYTFLLASAAGFDTSGRVDALAASRGVPYSALAMGSPEGYDAAEKAITFAATKQGGWVLLKNVHLATGWLQQLEKKLHRLQPVAAFKLFMTMEIGARVPGSLLASSQLVVYEPPASIKSSLERSLTKIPEDVMDKAPNERSRLHLLLAWMHAVILARLRYCPLGWSKQYEFSETDFSNALDTINLWVDATADGRSNLPPEKIPWAALRELIASTCYGGRVDNDFDLRSLESLLARLFTPESYGLNHSLLLNSDADNAPTLPEGKGRAAFMAWAHQLPEAQVPSWLGLPEDSDIVLLTQQAQIVLDGWLQLQASQAGAELAYNPAEAEQEEEGPKWSRTLRSSIENWQQLLPKAAVQADLVKGDDPIQRCVAREATLAHTILNKVRGDLARVVKCLSGEEQTTNEVRELLSYLRTASLPPSWRKHHAVPPKMKVDPWIGDLIQRLKKLEELVAACGSSGSLGSHKVWLGGLFQPGAFLTATRQWTARVRQVALESMKLTMAVGAAATPDDTSFLVDGAFLYGARLGEGDQYLIPGGSQSAPMPVLQFRWLVPPPDADKEKGLSEIPMYLTSERGEVFGSVDMKVEATKAASSLCWYEWGAAIALWAEA